MQCYKCKREYNGSAIRERQALLEVFFPPSVSNAAIQTSDNPTNPENVALLSRHFRERLFSDDFRHSYRQLRDQYFAIKVVCPHCGQELYHGDLQNMEHSIYSTLSDAEYDRLIRELNGRCGRDVQTVLGLVGDRRRVIDFAVRYLSNILGDQSGSISDTHSFVEQLRLHGRGGGGESGALAVLRDYLTNEFVKNAIYDIIKASGLFVLGWGARKIRERHITRSAAKKLRELGSTDPRPYEDDLTGTFRYLTKRERAQLARKIASRVSRQKLRDIRKLLK